MWTARILFLFFKSISSNRQLRYDTECLGANICVQHSYLSTCLYPQNNKHMIPKANKDICRALSDCVGTVIILRVGHESDLPMIQTALASTSLAGVIEASSVKEALTTTSQVCLLVQDKLDETQLVRQILTDALRGSTIYVIDNSWNTLQNLKVLFGDFIPRVGGKGKAAFGHEQQLSLNLWSPSASASLRNNAEMDPWTNLIEKEDLIELTLARIISTGHHGCGTFSA